MKLADIRQKYPQYSDLSDGQLAEGFHAKFYPDVDRTAFNDAIGFKPGERTWGQAFKDSALSVGQSFANLGADLSWLTDKVTPGDMSAVTRRAEQSAQWYEDRKSTPLKAVYDQLGAADGFVETLKTVKDNPEVIPDILLGSIAYMLPIGAAGRVASGARWATATVAGVGGVLEGAGAARQAEQQVSQMTLEDLITNSSDFRQQVESGISPEEAKRNVQKATGLTTFAVTTPLAALASVITGAAKLESRFFKGEGAGGFFAGLTRESVEEAAQEASNQFGANVGRRAFADDTQPLSEGVGSSAALGTVAGSGQAGAIGAIQLATGRRRGPDDDREAINRIFEAGDVDEAIEAANDGLGLRDVTPGESRPVTAVETVPYRSGTPAGSRLNANGTFEVAPIDQPVAPPRESQGYTNDQVDVLPFTSAGAITPSVESAPVSPPGSQIPAVDLPTRRFSTGDQGNPAMRQALQRALDEQTIAGLEALPDQTPDAAFEAASAAEQAQKDADYQRALEQKTEQDIAALTGQPILRSNGQPFATAAMARVSQQMRNNPGAEVVPVEGGFGVLPSNAVANAGVGTESAVVADTNVRRGTNQGIDASNNSQATELPEGVTIESPVDGTYVVMQGGKEIGRANVADQEGANHITSVRIDPEWQRKGIGTALYDHIEADRGQKLDPSPTYQTPASKQFWQKRSPTGQVIDATDRFEASQRAELQRQAQEAYAAEDAADAAQSATTGTEPAAQASNAPQVASSERQPILAALAKKHPVLADLRKAAEAEFGPDYLNTSDQNVKAAWQAERNANGKAIKEDDSLLTAIGKLGGLGRDWMTDITGDTKNKMVPGQGPLFRQAGTSPDDMASLLMQKGYMTESDLTNRKDNGGVRKLYDLINRELKGNRVYQIGSKKERDVAFNREEAYYRDQAEQAEAELEAQLEQIAAEHGQEAADLARQYHTDMRAYEAIVDTRLEAAVESQLAEERETDEESIRQAATEADAAEDRGTRDEGAGETGRRERAPTGQPDEDFDLSTQTESSLRADDARRAQLNSQAQSAAAAADSKANADREVSNFTLTGSDRTADVAAARGQDTLFQSAYHGTKHKFSKFSLDAIGTGEGSQAFGWGLYFASRREVAEFYRDQLSGTELKNFSVGSIKLYKDGIPQDYSPRYQYDGEEAIPRAVFMESLFADEWKLKKALEADPEAGKKFVLDSLDELIDQYYVDDVPGHIAYFNKIKKRVESGIMKVSAEIADPGQIYQVDLPEDSDLLNWDVTVSQQPEGVRAKLPQFRIEKITEPSDSKWMLFFGDAQISGFDTRKAALEYADKSKFGKIFDDMRVPVTDGKGIDRAKSMFFNSRGIPGLRFFDSISRDKQEGTHNYVIWDEDAVTVEAVNDELMQAEALKSVGESGQSWLIADTTTPGMTVEEVTAAITPAMEKLKQQFDLDVIVVARPSDIGIDPKKRYRGAYHNGAVYLFADNLQSARGAQVTLAHELIGHKGVLESATPEEWTDIKSTVDRLKKMGSKTANDIWNEVERRYPDESTETKYKEFLAIAAEKRVLQSKMQTVFAKIKATLRRILKAFGFNQVFSDSDIEIILSNSEKYLQESGKAMQSEESLASETAPTFYSALLEAARSLKQPKGTPDQMLAMLKKSPGVKQEELEWLGVEEFVKAAGASVTKQQIVDFIAANGVKVEVVEGGAEESPFTYMAREQLVQWYEDEVGYDPTEEDPDMSDEELRNLVEGFAQEGNESTGALGTKFAKYQLPGATNYREVLLKLPDPSWMYPGRKDAPSAAAEAKVYRSGHWDQPNVLAHIRLNDRTDADGRKVLFVEEVQSDFGQDTRRQRTAVGKAVDADFEGIVDRMKKAGVLEVVCD